MIRRRILLKLLNLHNLGIKRVEFLRYNILGKSKYDLLQKDYVSYSDETQAKEYMDDLCQRINCLIGEGILFWVE